MHPHRIHIGRSNFFAKEKFKTWVTEHEPKTVLVEDLIKASDLSDVSFSLWRLVKLVKQEVELGRVVSEQVVWHSFYKISKVRKWIEGIWI